MKVIINQLPVSVKDKDPNLQALAAKKLNLMPGAILNCTIRRKALDARKKADVLYKYALILDMADATATSLLAKGLVTPYKPPVVANQVQGTTQLTNRPIIVGAGPCGLFAAYTLAKAGLKPILLDRGKSIAMRQKDVEALETTGILDDNSNICFGEGGAGTFSDGKLTTRIKDVRAQSVLKTFVACGADETITYVAKPHLGTEGMRKVISNLRRQITKYGGEVIFGAKLNNMTTRNNKISDITYIKQDKEITISTEVLVLAIGHSANDTYRMLNTTPVFLEKKSCAIGFRVEHKRSMINQNQHGSFAEHLGAAEYSLTAKSDGRGIYSFCMCPGGMVVCSASTQKQLVVNGISYLARDMENSNAAIVVSLKPEDSADTPLGALDFIENLEKKAYTVGDGYLAPVQAVKDYLNGRLTKEFGKVKPSYKPGTVSADLNSLMPAWVNLALKHGLTQFNRKINGFMETGILTGVETRTSSPVRITRGQNLQSITVGGLYPAGEGAGYAGGIVSASVDGIRVAEQILSVYKNG